MYFFKDLEVRRLAGVCSMQSRVALRKASIAPFSSGTWTTSIPKSSFPTRMCKHMSRFDEFMLLLCLCSLHSVKCHSFNSFDKPKR